MPSFFYGNIPQALKCDETSKKKLGNHTDEPSSVIHQRKIGFNIVSSLSFSVVR